MEVFNDTNDTESFVLELQVDFEKDDFIVWHMFAHTRENSNTFYQMKKGIRLRTALIFFFRAYQRYRARTGAPKLAILDYTITSLVKRDLSVNDVLTKESFQEVIKVSQLTPKQISMLKQKWF